ncbi:tryptophan synthase beta subunit-like PLP-dependent enzyme [Penicillium pulvis]|uniref:tryptophan synthase beta subunit-like PLP-dependent enzyme n=1 Tax=Penicillium pulvis TaxID=1562058 RepID=UPI0025491D54|nr:tryptophan synthase beta subunit-like PLP-dependent enzyme [Penicillium pulvis]KAJ5785623.1 tryptophan synthase beta subunit-like PLP-dependent enzyme [Penicillium pulvis]
MHQSTPIIKKPWIETPLIESATLSKLAGCKIFLKLELLQPSGSFKSRGVGNLILSAIKNPANKNKAVHLYSSSGGNAGLAAVHAARDLNCACTVVVPHSTKPMMINKLRSAGATDVVQHGASWFEADTYLRESFIEKQPSPEENAVNVYVPPFDHPDIWEGAGSMVDEIAAQLPAREKGGRQVAGAFPADAIVCSVGGGGLFNGVVAGLEKHMDEFGSGTDIPGVKKVHVLAVETKGADSLAHSLKKGQLSSLDAITSLATSLGALCVAKKTLANAKYPPPGVQVSSLVGSDADAARGILRLADEMRLQVELACGISLEVAVAGRLKEVMPDLNSDSRVVVVVCGGSNITAEMIAEFRQRLDEGWE